MNKPITLQRLLGAMRRRLGLAGRPASPAPVPTSGTMEVERAGIRWRLDLSSCIARDIVAGGVWEPLTTQLIRDYVRPGMQVLDVGANFGYYTMVMAQQVGPSGRVWAFEPVRRYRERLEWHVAANGMGDRVRVVPFALSDRAGEATIGVHGATATLHDHENTPGPVERIELRALDEITAELGIERVDFVKIDVDGHEPFFLRGSARTLARWHPPMAMEFAQHCLHTAGSDVREQARLIRELGYAICSEATRRPYASEMDFLMECGNFSHSGNVLVVMPDVVGEPQPVTTERTISG